MTTYGKQITQKLVGEIAASGITIVSGFMYGIDATAHQAAVEVGGRTIAVMPCGIERIHPGYQIKLYNDILKNKGLIISEYEGDTQPGYWTYPARNRIVAGLAKAVLIVEAGEKSGSLITANFARKFKRKLFVVPGLLTSSLSAGICQLIREGAQTVTCAKDVLDYYNVKHSVSNILQPVVLNRVKHKPFKHETLDSLEQEIIQQLQIEPTGIDDLSRKLKINISEMSKLISFMEIKGQVKKENNKYYVS